MLRLLILMILTRFLVDSLSTFPTKGNPVFNYGSESLPKNPPDYSILYN